MPAPAPPPAPLRSGSLAAALSNLRWLLGSRGISAVLSLIYLAIVTRTLGPAGFGQFALVTGIGTTVVAVVSFQTWQLIVRYGTQHLHDGHPERLARVIKAAFALDVAAAIVGATLAGSAILLLGPSFGWPDETQRQAFVYCCVVLMAVRSTPTGVLRLYDRFSAAAAGDTMLPIVRLLGSLVVLLIGPSVPAFLAAWASSEVASSLLYWTLALRASRALPWRHARLSARVLKQENPGLYRFAAATNGGETLTLASRQMPVLFIGYFASPAAAGAYRLAHQLGRSMALVAQLFARALLPELMRMHTAGDLVQFSAMIGRIVRATAIGGVVLLVLVLVAGKPAINLIAGPAFAAAYPLLALLSVAAIIQLVGVGFQPALIATGRAGLSFALQAIGAAVQVGLILWLVPRWGPTGAAAAVVAGSTISVSLLAVAVRHVLARTSAKVTPEAIEETVPSED